MSGALKIHLGAGLLAFLEEVTKEGSAVQKAGLSNGCICDIFQLGTTGDKAGKNNTECKCQGKYFQVQFSPKINWRK